MRYYSFSIVSYHTDLSIIESVVRAATHYAYILHDRDTCQSPHFHIICTFRANLSFKSVSSLFPSNALDGSPRNTFVEALHDKYYAYRYLTHKDNPEKFQYADSDIFCNNRDYYLPKSAASDNEEFLNMLLCPYVSYREMATRYGRDFIRNHKSYYAFAEMILKQEEAIALGLSAKPLISIPYDSFVIDLHFSFHSIIEDLFGKLVADYKYPAGKLIKSP